MSIPADLVIEAFGQEMDQDVQRALTGIRLTDEGLIWLQPGSMQTSRRAYLPPATWLITAPQ